MKRAIVAVHGKSYTSQKCIRLYNYKTTGFASDWCTAVIIIIIVAILIIIVICINWLV